MIRSALEHLGFRAVRVRHKVQAAFAATPTLPPYHLQRTPARVGLRKSIVLTAIILAGSLYGFLISILPISFYLYLAAPIVLILLMVIWALPDSATYPAKTIERLFFALFLSIFLWPNYLAFVLPGLPWITMMRLWAFPMFLLTLISLSISKEFRGRVADPFKTSPWLFRLMIGFVILQVLTLPFSDHVGDSLNKLLDAQFTWTTVFFVAAFLFAKDGRARLFMILLCASSVFLCLLAIVEQRASQVLWAKSIPSFLAIDNESVARTLSGAKRAALGVHRVQGVFSTPLNFAEILGLATPCFIFFTLRAKSILLRFIVPTYFPLSFLVILWTDSRLGMVALFSSFLLYLLLWGIRKWVTTKTSLFAPLIVLTYPAVAIGFFALTFVWQRLGRMVWGGGAQQASTEGRMRQWSDGFPMVLEWPFGHGIGEGAMTLGRVNLVGVLTIDSYYLVILLEYGILGFFVFFGLVLTGVWQAVKFGVRSTSEAADMLLPAAVMLSVFAIVKGVLAQDDSHSLTFMILGMVAALCHQVNTEGSALK